MKIIRIIFIAFSIWHLTSCTHITLLGHKSAYDVNAEFSGDPIAPVSINAGFEGRSFAAVPPKKAVGWWKNFDNKSLPTGDVMSTILQLKIEKVNAPGAFGNVPFDYVTSGATGLAADAAAGADPTVVPELEKNTAGATEGKTNAQETSNKIKTITDSGPDTFGQ